MMEEFDFEDEVLSIHPDEDIRKIEVIDVDTNSIHPDEDTRQIEVIDIDTNSIHPDEDDRKTEVIDLDANSIQSDEDDRKIKVIEIDKNSNLEQASDSDSGEIDDDEEANDLEEGEIKDSSPVSKKKSDIACRFFKRGSCVFGSQCQYLHLSDSVYKMFDTNPQKRNNMPLVEHRSFPKPLIFPPNVLPPRPFIEPPLLVVQKNDYQRQGDTLEDTWEKGLEQARILIRKANLKKQNEESEGKKFDSKSSSKDEKAKGQYFTKSDLGNELRNIVNMNNKKYSEKNSTNSSFRKEKASDENKTNYRYQPKSNDKWVDPWRRSKSPNRKRPRSLSGSPPSRSRKHSSTSSTSSITTSSSEFDDIYRRPYEKKSPKGQQGFKSRSRSVSQSRRPKKQRISPKRPFNGRRNSRSASKSFSISPYRKRTFSLRTQSRSSSSSSSCSDCRKSPTVEDQKMKRISAKLGQQISHDSPKRISELLDSDCETSEMTVSSASCTPLSSDSEADSLRHSPTLNSRKSPNRNRAPYHPSKTTNLSNPRVFNRNQSNLSKSQDVVQRRNDTVPAYQRRMQPSDNRKNLNNWNIKTEPTDYKPKNTASCFSSVKKPASAPKFQKDKMTSDMELLFMYQGLGNTNKNSSIVPKGKANNPASKPNRTEDTVNVTNKANGNSESYDNASKVTNAPKKNIALNLQPKSKDYLKSGILDKSRDFDEIVTIKKETASKREQLLNKLKLIDDAIARKKGK